METKGILLIFISIIVGFYLKLDWLVFLLVLFLFFVALGSMSGEKKRVRVQKPAEEVIYPIIYEDVGEPPYLYHPASEINVKSDWTPWYPGEEGAIGIGNAFKAVRNFIVGSKKKEKKE